MFSGIIGAVVAALLLLPRPAGEYPPVKKNKTRAFACFSCALRQAASMARSAC
jgi:hypothetical protein